MVDLSMDGYMVVKIVTSMFIKGDAAHAEELIRAVNPALSAVIEGIPDSPSAITTLEVREPTPMDAMTHLLMHQVMDAGMVKDGQMIDLTPGREQRN